MHMFKPALAGFCLIIQIFAEEVKVETKNPCEAGEGHNCESSHGVSALQMTWSKEKGQNLLEEPDESETKSEPRPKFHAVELWQDIPKLELFDADALASGDFSVSQQDWLQAFSKLDVNKDGKVDASDLGSVETQCANHHFNATQEHYRKAVAMMVDYFPEFKDFIIEHESAVLFFAEMNKSAPEDAPLPSMESMELFQNNSKALALTEWARARHIATCAYAVITFVSEAVGWGLQMMDVYVMGYFPDNEPPIHLFNAIQETAIKEYKDRAKNCWEAITQGHYWTAANIVWDILYGTYNLGILEKIIRAAFASMSWWDWMSTGTSMLAMMLAQMASAGAVLIGKMLHQIVNAYNLIQQGKEVVETCQR